jgi:hypothetical protein
MVKKLPMIKTKTGAAHPGYARELHDVAIKSKFHATGGVAEALP